jgi:hypothetical protein
MLFFFQKVNMIIPLEWLLAGSPWITYRTRLDLLGEPEDDSLVSAARKLMINDPQVSNLIDELSDWRGAVIASHKSAGQPFHKLAFLADLGVRLTDPGMDRIVSNILAHQSDEGPFQLTMNIPDHYGGTGKDTWAWALCDAPIMVYALIKFGLRSSPEVQPAIDHLAGFAAGNGWPCVVSKELGSFRGPGRKEDPCPYATLVMLKMLSELEAWRDSPVCRTGAETLLRLWEESLTKHPYIFYMGTDFRRLKVPFIWYDLMHVLEVLSRFSWLNSDERLLEMLSLLRNKMDLNGRFTIDSVWMAWKGWEFGQKKEPSRWLTLMAWRILKRFEG